LAGQEKGNYIFANAKIDLAGQGKGYYMFALANIYSADFLRKFKELGRIWELGRTFKGNLKS
jgi:hypothetical protein